MRTKTLTAEALQNGKSLIKQLTPRLIDFVRERTGIEIDSKKLITLCYFIHQTCQKLKISSDAYLSLLEEAGPSSSVFNELLQHLMVGESYFFRDKQQITLLQETLLPKILESKLKQNDLSLRIWSAGCASGEEIYTLAMLVDDILGPGAQNHWSLHFLGTDINQLSLETAKSGYYRANAMRTMPAYFLNKYFKHEEKNIILSTTLKNLVKFQYLNLIENQYPSLLNGTNALDLILCRNVLIYFDDHHIHQVMLRLSHCLTEQGILILGASDPILIQDTGLVTNLGQAAYFTKSNHAPWEHAT